MSEGYVFGIPVTVSQFGEPLDGPAFLFVVQEPVLNLMIEATKMGLISYAEAAKKPDAHPMCKDIAKAMQGHLTHLWQVRDAAGTLSVGNG